MCRSSKRPTSISCPGCRQERDVRLMCSPSFLVDATGVASQIRPMFEARRRPVPLCARQWTLYELPGDRLGFLTVGLSLFVIAARRSDLSKRVRFVLDLQPGFKLYPPRMNRTKPLEKTQYDLRILLPDVPDERDACVGRLTRELEFHTGIEQAHLVTADTSAELYIHYDPDIIALPAVERIVKRAGGELTKRYRHVRWPVSGLDCSDCAFSLEHILKRETGVEAVSVNPASEKIAIEYDTEATDEKHLRKRISQIGYSVETEAEPTWLKEHWELLLAILSGVFLATGFFGELLIDMPGAVALSLYGAAYLAGGFNTARHGIAAALKLRFDIDFLMVVAAMGAATLGEFAEGALLLFLFSLGHALEHLAMDRARRQISSLGELAPKTARVVVEEAERDIPADELEKGMIVVVRAGERLPVDGEIEEGSTSIDQSSVTGESVPVEKGPGESVFAGTVNGNKTIRVRVTKLAKDSTLSRVIEMVEEAESQQSPSQRFAERFTRVFVPAVLAIVLLTIAVPPLLGWLSFSDAFLRAMTILVAASPCALAIATPAAILSGVARAARSGILLKGGMHLENLGTLSAVAFDKTGTITAGEFEVTDLSAYAETDEEELLSTAAAVEAGSNHPLAAAVQRFVETRGTTVGKAEGVEAVGGKGVTGSVDGKQVRVGNRKLFEEGSIPRAIEESVQAYQSEGKTCMIVQREDAFLGVLALQDRPRKGAERVVEQLRKLGISRTILITGDNRDVAKSISEEVGIDEYRAELMPEDKVTVIKELEKEYGSVAMVGDGVNDAPALATATVGIAMGAGGTDVALETADVALMADDIGKMRFAVELSRRARRTIVQNLAISLGVMAVLVATAITGVATIGIAIVAHEGSTLLVVANALRLLGVRESR